MSVTCAGWTMTGRWLGQCRSCKAVIREDHEPSQAFTGRVAACTCGRLVKLQQVSGCVTERRCSSLCTNAKRSDCECSCGGENHGSSW